MKKRKEEKIMEEKEMELYPKNGNAIYILNILKKYSDQAHMLSATEIARKVKEIYDVEIDPRTVRRIINLLKEKLDYDISTREENKKGYYILKNPDTDFEAGEIRAIIDTFSYANYIVPAVAKNIIQKCKNMQNIYENQKLCNYQIYSNDAKTENMEVIKNIEDIADCIQSRDKIQFEYWKYHMGEKVEKQIWTKPIVAPYAIVYNNQEFYLIGIKEGQEDFYHYRLDRIKNLKKLDQKRTIAKTNRQIKEFAESTVKMFGGKKERIEAICSMHLLDVVFDDFGKNITIQKTDDENFRLILEVSTRGFKTWVMRNIDSVEVVKPVSLRSEIKEIIEVAKKKYNH